MDSDYVATDGFTLLPEVAMTLSSELGLVATTLTVEGTSLRTIGIVEVGAAILNAGLSFLRRRD